MRRGILIVFALLIGVSGVWAKDTHPHSDRRRPNGHSRTETAREAGARLCTEKTQGFVALLGSTALSLPCLQAHGLVRDVHTVGDGDQQQIIFRFRDEQQFD